MEKNEILLVRNMWKIVQLEKNEKLFVRNMYKIVQLEKNWKIFGSKDLEDSSIGKKLKNLWFERFRR